MRPPWSFLVVMLLWPLAPLPAQSPTAPIIAPPPAWVKQTSLPDSVSKLRPPADQTNTPIAILKREHQVRLSPELTEIFTLSLVRVQGPQGLAAFGTIALPWNPATQSLTIHALKIHRDGQAIDILTSQRFSVIRRESNLERQALDGVLSATLQPEGLRVGIFWNWR